MKAFSLFMSRAGAAVLIELSPCGSLTKCSPVLAVEGLARNVRVPVHECAIGIVLPGPHVERIKRRESETIRAVEQVEKLAHELRRTRVRRVPCVGNDDKIGPDKTQASTWGRLINHNLGTSGVQNA